MSAAETTDLYEILGVSRQASADDIKRAYRKLARKYHPDVNPGDAAAEESFKRVSAAFDVLGDTEKRKIYDEFGAAGLEPGFDPEKARAYQEWQQRARASDAFRGGEDPLSGLGGFDLGDIFSGFARSGPQPGGDVETEVRVSLRDAVLGAEREVAFHRASPCESCGGRGHVRAASPRPCSECGGAGRVGVARGPMSFQRACAACGGSGESPGPPCPSCQGRGVAERLVRLKVKIPAGIDDGKSIRLAGQGLPGRGGGPAGDLFLRVRVEPHPHLRRTGRDLELHVPVTVGEAMFGAKIEVPTLQGPIKLSVPAGSQCGARLRVRGRGVGGGEGAPGDLYVILDVHVPQASADDPAVREAVANLGKLYPRDVRAGLEL